MFCSNCGTSFLFGANFCHACRNNLDEEQASLFCCERCGRPSTEDECQSDDCVNQNVNDTIKDYFHRGYPYNDIVKLLEKQGIIMHVRTLKRKLKDLGLSRRGRSIDEEMVRNVIAEEIAGPGSLAGYRSVWHALRLRHQIHVPRNLVARLIKELDPEGVEDRRSRRLSRRQYSSLGPNFCWHIDGMIVI